MTPNLILDPSAPQDDSTEGILLEIGRLLVQYAPQIEAAMNANVPPTAA